MIVFDANKLARPCVQRCKEYIPGKPAEEVRRELGLDDVLKMASNENPLGPSPRAVAAMMRELQSVNLYPEGLCPELTLKLAAKHQLSSQHFFLDNGLDGVITMLGLAFVNPGEEVIMGELSFAAYANITNKMGGECVPVPMTDDGRLDVVGMIGALSAKTKMIFLCNPNNPTGTIVTRAEFDRLIAAVPETVLVVSDEAYYEFADSPDYPQSLDYLPQHPNLIVMRTFSKVMGLAGMRLGYAMAHPEVVKVLLKVREPFPVNRIAQAGALAALDDAEFINRALQANRAGREQLDRGLAALGILCYPSQTNFVYADLGRPAQPIFQALLREGIIIRPLGPSGRPNCARITVGTHEQNERALQALRKVLEV